MQRWAHRATRVCGVRTHNIGSLARRERLAPVGTRDDADLYTSPTHRDFIAVVYCDENIEREIVRERVEETAPRALARHSDAVIEMVLEAARLHAACEGRGSVSPDDDVAAVYDGVIRWWRERLPEEDADGSQEHEQTGKHATLDVMAEIDDEPERENRFMGKTGQIVLGVLVFGVPLAALLWVIFAGGEPEAEIEGELELATPEQSEPRAFTPSWCSPGGVDFKGVVFESDAHDWELRIAKDETRGVDVVTLKKSGASQGTTFEHCETLVTDYTHYMDRTVNVRTEGRLELECAAPSGHVISGQLEFECYDRSDLHEVEQIDD